MFDVAFINPVLDDGAEGNGLVLIHRHSCSRVEFASFDGLRKLKLGHGDLRHSFLLGILA